jgi:pyruvate/2-oxoglutarate/acetoin dehydrogenase E1 component
LEKHLLGIDNVAVVALSSLLNPAIVIEETHKEDCPMVILESKIDYGRFLWTDTSAYSIYREQRAFGSVRLSPIEGAPTITIVSYGETARHIADNLELFFMQTDQLAELICVTKLHPVDLNLLERSINKTRRILVVEDGSVSFGFGSEILSKLVERGAQLEVALRVGAEPVPVPSIINLELEILPTINKIIDAVKKIQIESFNG